MQVKKMKNNKINKRQQWYIVEREGRQQQYIRKENLIINHMSLWELAIQMNCNYDYLQQKFRLNVIIIK